MKDKENTKKALIFSVLLIVLSVMFLVGTTFAWFTDVMTSGNNRIIAGNLDVELYHLNGELKEKVTEDTKLFDVALWEPGAMAYENFEVSNEGALALNYKFMMNVGTFNTVLDSGKSLKDILKIAFVDGEFSGTREEATMLDFDMTISDFISEGDLNGDNTSKKFGIVVYWEPSIEDDDFNLNNGKVSNDGEPLFIDLGVSLVATQNPYEEDAFGNDYDDRTVQADSDEDFISVLKNLKEDEVVKLTDDVVLTETMEFRDSATTNIDLNGHTITSNIAATTFVNSGEVIIKNGTLNLKSENDTQSTFFVNKGAVLTLDHVDYVSDTGAGIFPSGENATINIVDSSMKTRGMAITTNANSPENYNVKINIKSSTLTTFEDDGAGTPVLVNVPCTLNIADSQIVGYFQGLVVRGGTAIIKNSTITNNEASGRYVDYFKNRQWFDGNGVNLAALTIGNKNDTYYKYPTKVTLINTTVKSLDNLYPDIYAYGNTEDEMGVTFKYDAKSSVGNVVVGNEAVVINGTKALKNEE